ncbi:MAG TPA: M28 family peptidase [Myxococcaceae bacterium]|nr:M28 family peptidase [Myxococcaceae bacterium]
MRHTARRTTLLLSAPFFLLLAACATAAAAPASARGPDAIFPGATDAASSIRPEVISAHIRFLADDLLGGRMPGERGYDIAAAYVASQLQGMGLEPAGDDGSWFQQMTLRGGRTRSARLEVGTPGGDAAALAFEREFIARAPLGNGTAEVTAPVVYVGHGIVAPEYRWDDLAGVELKGKVAMVLMGAPLGTTPDFFPPIPSAVYGSPRSKLERLMARGAAGVLWVQTPTREKIFSFANQIANNQRGSMALVENGLVAARESFPQASLSMAGADALLTAAGRPERVASLVAAAERREQTPLPLGTQVHLRVEAELRTVHTANVVGLWRAAPGSPAAGEDVVYTAHLDHLGIGKPEAGDAIYNGASDNASGVANVLEIARAFTRLPQRPRRGVLFALVSGEEEGLLGSEWFVEHPPVRREALVADVNADSGLPVFPPHEVVALGADESTLRDDAQRAVTALGLALGPDPEPQQAAAVRSDQYSFLRAGIPATATRVGLGGTSERERAEAAAYRKAHYHRAADHWEPDRDHGPAAAFARFQFLLGLSVTQRSERPRLLPGSFFQPRPSS